MSFLAGRLASTEGAYFLQESKHAVGRLAQMLPSQSPPPPPPSTMLKSNEEQSDILPEVLRHSLPLKVSMPQDSSLFTASKWLLQDGASSTNGMSSSDAINPLRGFLSMPQVTFGPKRWQLPNVEHSVIASTANDLRRDTMQTNVDPKKLKAAAEGLTHIGKAFFIATTIVFGGATLTFMLMASKLQMHDSADVRTKGKELLQPKFDVVNKQLAPLRTWAENMSRKWHFDREGKANEKPDVIKELSKRFGARTPN